jgi:hypothetical protein
MHEFVSYLDEFQNKFIGSIGEGVLEEINQKLDTILSNIAAE